MIIEEKVTTRKLSKRMVELGWDYETERYWLNIAHGSKMFWQLLSIDDAKDFPWAKKIVAPDAIEIGVVLPFGFTIGKTKTGFACCLHFGLSFKFPHEITNRDLWDITRSDTEAEAGGLLWCWLKETKLI